MKLVDAAVALALAVLLTWLLVRGLGPSDPQTQAALQALDHYAATQSALDRDVLRARSGLLRNYDAIVDHSAAMERDLRAVRDNLEEAGAARLLSPIEADFREQEHVTERFKSGNALLQNSLSYFGLFSSRLIHAGADDRLARAVESLSGEMLHLTLDTSDATIGDVGAKLKSVAAMCRRAACPEDAGNLLAHGTLLHDLLPRVDRSLAALVAADRDDPVQRLRAHLQERERSVEAASVRFRLLLYGASLLLVVLLLKGEVQLRARASDLRRQVALEHAVASLSAGLIGGGARTTTLVQAGLEQLARALGASRAYYYRECSGGFCAWPAHDHDLAAALHLAQRMDRSGSTIVQLRTGTRDIGAVDAALLRGLGAAQWIGVLPGPEGALNRFLAFELDTGDGRKLPRQLTVLRTAFDAICLAFEHEEAEAARQRLTEQLAHARRMETIGAFTSGFAHNFNNLIGAISGYAEMAQSGLRNGSASLQHIDQIQRAAERGRSLLDGLLDYGRRRAQRREAVDLRALIDETRDMVDAALGPSHSIAIAHAPDPVLATIDPAQIQTVLLNLCRNAVQAMEEGGTVAVETGLHDLPRPLPHPHGPVPAGRYATVTVRDSGGGIAPGSLKRLFEPFYSTKATGNGLGLATAREILADFQGLITIDSEPGRGTLARVWLPRFDGTLPASSHQADPSIYARGRGEMILVLVEEPQRRLSTEDVIAALGYEPIGVDSPERLIEIVEQASSSIDAVLVCFTETNEESWALLAELRDRCPGIPRLLGIGSAAQLEAARLAEAGISAIVRCPPRPGELAAALRRCLGTDPAVARTG